MADKKKAATKANKQSDSGGWPATDERLAPDGKSAPGKKKQVPLRLSESLYNDLAAWAEDDFRSLNGQIEYLLTQCVKKQRRGEKDETL